MLDSSIARKCNNGGFQHGGTWGRQYPGALMEIHRSAIDAALYIIIFSHFM